MTSMQSAHTLLRLVTEFIPPPVGTRHSITLNGDNHLELQLVLGSGRFLPVVFDGDGDLDKNPRAILEEIEAHLSDVSDECHSKTSPA